MRTPWLKHGLVAASVGLVLGGALMAGAKEPRDAPAEPRTRLVTQQQYENVIASLFGRDVVPTFQLPPLPRTEGLNALGAAEVGVTLSSLERFRQVAGVIAGRVTDPAHRAHLIPCRPKDEAAADAVCARQFLARTSRMLFRRSLHDSEIARLVDDAGRSANQLHDFYGGLQLVVGSMLYDPEFLFVIDKTEPDPARPSYLRLTDESIATRLSLFLWNSLPDASLLDAAERGELRNRQSRTRIIDAMIRSPRLQEGVRAFFDDMLGLADLASISKDRIIYPAFGGATGPDAREQALMMIVDHLITRNQDYRDLFTTRQIFLTPDLAVLYGVPAPSQGWSPFRISDDDPRGGVGLLTQIGFLAGNSHPGRSSPTQRGRAMREMLLCQVVPDPPPNVDFTGFEDPNSTFRTTRERLASHSNDPVCAGCHKITDPIGLAMENFDGSGAFRTIEKGVLIDTSGSFDGQTFDNVSGLGKALGASPALTSCLVNRLYAYAIARPTKGQDNAMLNYLESSFQERGYRVPDLMRSIALSDTYITAGPESLTPKLTSVTTK